MELVDSTNDNELNAIPVIGNKINYLEIVGEHFLESLSQSDANSTSEKNVEKFQDGSKPYSCNYCIKTFATKYSLKTHRRIHTGEKPYPCGMCSKNFKTSGDLLKHIRTHTGEKPYVCEVCKRGFSTSNIKKMHLRTHTGERPYKCDVEGCGRSFASVTNYNNHYRIHTGERPFMCNVKRTVHGITKRNKASNAKHTQKDEQIINSSEEIKQDHLSSLSTSFSLRHQEKSNSNFMKKTGLSNSECSSLDHSAITDNLSVLEFNGSNNGSVFIITDSSPITSLEVRLHYKLSV